MAKLKRITPADIPQHIIQRGNIRKNINKGLALGNEVFIKEIEVLNNARVSSRKAGRPKKNVE